MSIPVAVDHSAHAVYAPSSAHRWTVCTASAEAIARLPPQEEGEEAAKGTAAHDEIERCLGALNSDPKGAIIPVSSAHPSAHGIALVLDFARQLAESTPGRFWIEQRVRLTDQIWGRCDVSHWYEPADVLTIVDYKDGYVGVDAEENPQLRIYAAAAIKTFNLPAKWIRYVIVQPNDFRPVPRVKQWVESAGTLHVWADPVSKIPDGPKQFVVSEECKYCPLFGRCPATQDVLAQIGTMLVNTPDQVRPEQVKLFLACKKPIDDWFKALEKDQTKRALSTGVVPDGMKIVTAQTKRAWLNEADARKAVLEKFGVEALDPPTPAQAEKLGLDVSQLAASPEGGPVLAFESDRRKPWVQKSAADMFGGLVTLNA